MLPGITLSVLTGSTLRFFVLSYVLGMACLYVTPYSTNVSPAVENGAWHPIHYLLISFYLPHVSHQFQARRILSRTHLEG